MAFIPVSILLPHFHTSNGTPLAGGTLELYEAGTSTPAEFFTADGTTLGTSESLDARGEPSSDLYLDSAGIYKFRLLDASSVLIREWDNVAPPISANGTIEWLSPKTATFVDSDTFTIEGDLQNDAGEAVYHAGRRVRIYRQTNDDYLYATIDTASYASGTDKTTVNLTRITDADGAAATLSNEALTAWAGVISYGTASPLPTLHVSVEQFGATGDGTTDDTDALQAAITYVYGQGGGEVHFPPGTYKITKPLLTASGVGLVGTTEISRVGTPSVTIKKTTTTASTVEAARSGTSTEIDDGFDGTDHFPNCIIHATSDLVSDGDAQSFSMKGIKLDGTGVCDYGVYARRTGSGYFGYNRIDGCKMGFVWWSFIFLSRVEYNYVENCERGYYIDSCTSLEYTGNYARVYSEYAHKVTRGLYSTFTNNAADRGAFGETASYATAYFFRNCLGCQIANNGAETLNGRFMQVEQSNGSTFENNTCPDYELTYTGADQIEAFKLVTPFAAFRNNVVVFTGTVNKAANHYNVHVSSQSSTTAFLWDHSNAFVDDTGGATHVYSTLEQGFGQSSLGTFARRAGVNLLGQDTTFFVDGATGDDQDTGASGSPVATIQKVIDSLPRPVHVSITIDVAAGTYAEDLDISNIEGTGKIVLSGDGINSTILNGNQSVTNNQVPVDFTGCSFTAAGTTQTHIIFNNADGSVHSCEYDTAATGTANQFVRAAGHSRVGVYSNTYTSTTGANIIRADGAHAHIIVDSATAAAVGMSTSTAGRISLAGVETAL